MWINFLPEQERTRCSSENESCLIQEASEAAPGLQSVKLFGRQNEILQVLKLQNKTCLLQRMKITWLHTFNMFSGTVWPRETEIFPLFHTNVHTFMLIKDRLYHVFFFIF